MPGVKLSRQVNEQLRELSARGTEADRVFVDAPEAPDAYLVVGQYTLEGAKVTVDIRVIKDGTAAARFVVVGHTSDVDELVSRMVGKVADVVTTP